MIAINHPGRRHRATAHITRGSAACILALAAGASGAAAQQFTRPGAITTLSPPVSFDTTGRFLSAFSRVCDDIFVAGQPTERGLRELRSQGVTTVVNLRTPPEMARVKFDEAALVKELGMTYVYVPVRGDSAYSYAPATIKAFAAAVSQSTGKVLLHCTVAWRASHLWAAYLIQERHVPVEAALANARAINLMDTMRIGNSGRQPVEDFLDRTLPTLGHPSKP